MSKAVDTREELSKISGVSQGSIQKVEFINQRAPEEVKQKLVNGEVSINRAYKEIKNPGLFTSETDEWYTPKEIIDSVLKVFGGQIDVDPCSNSSINPNVPAAGTRPDWISTLTKRDRVQCISILTPGQCGRDTKLSSP